MSKDIYDLLNNGDFHEEEYENINKEEFNDLEVKRIKKYINKNSKRRNKSKRYKAYAIAAACILIFGISNSTIRTEVWASVNSIISRIDPNKNYESDYVVKLDDNCSKNGVELKLDECYRSMNKIRLVYTLNFEDEVPESVKAKERLRTDLEVGGNNYEYVGYENNGIAGCKIKINDWAISEVEKLNVTNYKYGVWIYESRDIEITDKSIKKEVIFSLDSFKVKDDLNIEISYDNIVKNSGDEIKGPWIINHKVNMEENTVDSIEKTKFDKDYGYKYDDNRMASIESYANTNTGIKIFGKVINMLDMPVLRLEGTDNLGNRILMYSTVLEMNEENSTDEVVYQLYDGQTDNRQSLDPNVTSLKLALYAEEYEDNNYSFKQIGEEFTVNIK